MTSKKVDTTSRGLFNASGPAPIDRDTMSETLQPEVGTISWTDITVDNAGDLKDFYAAVVGWKPDPVKMGNYNDYAMFTPSGSGCVAGICHARGVNAGLPSVWLVYITVGNLSESILKCEEHGGSVLGEPRNMGSAGRFCVIRDPSGAVVALFEPALEEKKAS